MQEKLKDKIAGALVGYAIGDALGLGTEFMTADEAKSIYPDSLTDYSQIEMDAHRSPWGHGNYTHDTEFVIMLIENVLRDGELRPLEFARSMADWYGDGHYDISQQMRAVLREPSYRNDPYGTVERIWKQRGKWLEAGAIIGIAPFAGIICDEPDNAPIELSRTLQNGQNPLGASNVIARSAYAILYEDRIPDADELVKISEEYSPDIEQYIRAAAEPGAINRLEIDDVDSIDVARKCMAVGLWALWNFDNFDDGIVASAMLGGDADTNTALAGALMGLKYGLSAIPMRLRSGLVKQKEIEMLAEKFADYLAPRFNN